MTAELAGKLTVAPGAADETTAWLRALIDPGFLTLMGWDTEAKILIFPPGHPVLGYAACKVDWCVRSTYAGHGLCTGCHLRWKGAGQPVEVFLTDAARHPLRVTGTDIGPCAVPGCPRPWKSGRVRLCSTHDYQQKNTHRLPLEEFLAHPQVRPLPSFGPCAVAACDRDRAGSKDYCVAHRARLAWQHRRDPGIDEYAWRQSTPGVTVNGRVSLRGLPDRLVAQILYGLQQRTGAGVRTKDHQLRPLCDLARTVQASCLAEIPDEGIGTSVRGMRNSFRKFNASVGLNPDTERLKDVWNTAPFGHPGTLRFTGISQRWLRDASKRWAYGDLPRRRGNNPLTVVGNQIKQMSYLSESLRLQRPDHGDDITSLSRSDITAFLNRLAYLAGQGQLSAATRVNICRSVRGMLSRMRAELGLTRAGEPLHGLPEDFALGRYDVPGEPDGDEAGKDLPAEVMRVLCASLPAIQDINGPEVRLAIELVIDTGRRPDETCTLAFDCLERDEDGKPVLIYDNHKNHRNRRRLPIGEATAGLITGQQERVRARFPATAQSQLRLLPSPVSNKDGTKPLSHGWIGDRHRTWVNSLPPIIVPIAVEIEGQRVTRMLPFDKAKIFLYAYRHTYAQRHADAGVNVDVLRELMDHRQLTTTQRYYRVGEERRREAVDRVTAMQFDRHGTRIWRQAKALLDSEHTRRAVGETAVPYGGCTEPGNVAAGGRDCPVRFRCVGCGHFRTDVSYLPDLETYLADLLRNRERMAATFNADEWAITEAMPSDEEIRRVRRLITRVSEDLGDLGDEDKTQILDAVAVVRRHRQNVVGLGLPAVRQPLPSIRTEQTA